MDQDRRDAAAWAKEWQIKRKNRRILYVLAGILAVAAIGYLISFITIHTERTTFGSAEEMRLAMQGRYAIERDYEDIIIEGDEITLTYLSLSHYDREYAEKYGYEEYDDSVYDDHVKEWDYRHGVLKTEWMDDLIIDSDGNIHKGKYTILYKTDRPRPEPIDPSTLNNPQGDPDAVVPEDVADAIDERADSIEEATEAAAAAAAKDS